MGFSRHFNVQYGFAYTQCFGTIDDNSLRIHILSFNYQAKGMTTIRELADTRKLEKADQLTVKGAIELAALDRDRSAGRHSLLAIVVANSTYYEMACLYAAVSKSPRKDARVFFDTGQALSWLGYQGREMNALDAFMKQNHV